jgi:hypothetical protein
MNRVPTTGHDVFIDPAELQTISISGGTHPIKSLTVEDNLILSSGTLDFADFFDMNGDMTLSGGTLQGAGDFTLNGVFTWTGGTISMTGDFYNQTGSVFNAKVAGPMGVGTFYNDGTLFMGSSPGALAINGSYTQGAGGSLDIELGGLTQGATYDLLEITGKATLNGTLNVNLYGGFTPISGNQFDVITYASAIGDFATKNLPDGYAFQAGDQGSLYRLEIPGIPVGEVTESPSQDEVTPPDIVPDILSMEEQIQDGEVTSGLQIETEKSIDEAEDEEDDESGKEGISEMGDTKKEEKKKGRLNCNCD